MSLSLFLLGSRRIGCSAAYSAALLDLCLVKGIQFADFCGEPDGAISFSLPTAEAKRLLRLANTAGIAVRAEPWRGLPAILWRYRRRVGLLIGVVLIALLLIFAERFVWDVRVTGNVTMTESEVIGELRACGFGVGSYIPSVHAASLENRVLLASDRISWISVYLDGTVARVQVIEHVATPPPTDTSRPANLVAAVDGQIELIELYRGNCVVKVGQAVRRGDLLVSGLYDSTLHGYRYTRAAGKILARTERTLRIEIPLSYTEKVYQDEKIGKIYLQFFDYSLKVFKSVGNGTDTCDIIKEEINPSLLGAHTLPIGITVEKWVPYVEKVAIRTHEDALSLAYAELDRELAGLSEQVEVLGKTIRTELGEARLVLVCTLSCIEDIALQSEFEIIE